MYSRNKSGEAYAEDAYDLFDYGLPPKYDGSRFRRPRGDVVESEISAETGTDGIVQRLGEKLGEEELLIIALMLAVSSGGAECEARRDDVLLLLAFLLICR
ncbi:MAG: hypothetical protein MJ096_01110 [Clostridia bacterium]|nr:hypothetical protein [Clostridia bacterium]